MYILDCIYFEKYLIAEGLNKVQAEMIAEIDAVEKAGKNPLMTKGYIEITIKELKAKLKIEG